MSEIEEIKKISSFIDSWQSKNGYNPKELKKYNKLFKTEFNEFLNNSNLSKETINFYKI